MIRSVFVGLVAGAALVPVSFAGAQSHSEVGGATAHDHSAMPSALGSVVTIPADNAMLAASPPAFSATFPHAMTLESLRLTGAAGQPLDVAVSSVEPPTPTVTTPLPALAPGSYSAAWVAKGADGHRMNGVVRFMVH